MSCPHCGAHSMHIKTIKCKKCGKVIQTYCTSCGKIIDESICGCQQ